MGLYKCYRRIKTPYLERLKFPQFWAAGRHEQDARLLNRNAWLLPLCLVAFLETDKWCPLILKTLMVLEHHSLAVCRICAGLVVYESSFGSAYTGPFSVDL